MSLERRGVVVGTRGMVSAGDSFAAAAALDVLQRGGNAIDAAIAASAVQCVVELPWCSLAGDLFMLVATPDRGVAAFNGSGPAPRALRRELISGPRAPRTGPLSVGVPGLVATWDAVHQRYATRPLAELLEPAIAYARNGFAVYPRFERAIAKIKDRSTPLGELIEANGQHVGERFAQPALAKALADIANGGLAAFSTGDVGRAMVEHLRRGGGVLSLQDLAEVRVEPVAPIGITYRGRQIVSHPPVSLGCVLLEELKILEGFDLSGLEDVELIELLVACKQAAFADAADLGDPAERDNRVEWLLSEERAGYWREQLGTRAHQAVTAGGNDTTSTVVADEHGNVVTLIQSLFNEFGSRELVPECGILLNDRLANLALDPELPNGLRGGRRPLHTLNTYMVLDGGEPVLAGATPGGRGQVQINLQVLVNVLDRGMDIQAAVDAPRWISGLPYRGANDQTLYVEPTFAAGIPDALRSRGHQVESGVEAGDQADPFGNCTVLARSPGAGTLQGAADSRRDAFAIGY